MSIRWAARVGVAIALLLLVAAVPDALPIDLRLPQWDAGNNPFAAGDLQATVSFVLIGSLLIMIGTPRLIFFTLGGLSFGFASGLLFSLAACLTGSHLTFRAARWVGHDWIRIRFGE